MVAGRIKFLYDRKERRQKERKRGRKKERKREGGRKRKAIESN